VPLLGDLPEGTDELWVLLPFRSGSGRPGEADIQVKLVDAADGGDVPVEWSVSDTRLREPDLAFFLIRIDARRLGPGGYRLDFRATDPSSGASSITSAVLVKR